jgi:hypothetical protein
MVQVISGGSSSTKAKRSGSVEDYDVMRLSIAAWRELETSDVSANEKANFQAAMNTAYSAIGHSNQFSSMMHLRAQVARIDSHYSLNISDSYDKLRDKLARHAFAEAAEIAIEQRAEERRAEIYDTLDDGAKRRVAILSEIVDVSDADSIENYARAIVESTASQGMSEAHIDLTAARTTQYLQENEAILGVHNAASPQARLDSSLAYEAQNHNIRQEIDHSDISNAREGLLAQYLDRGLAAIAPPSMAMALSDEALQAPSDAEIAVILKTQEAQMQVNCKHVFAQLSPAEQALIGDYSRVSEFLASRAEINRLVDDSLGRKQQVFDAAVMLAEGEGLGVLSAEIQRDAAIVNYTSLLISSNIVENLASNALALDGRYQEAFAQKGEARVDAVRDLLRENNEDLKNVPDAQIDFVIHSTLQKVDGLEAGGKSLNDLSQGELSLFAEQSALAAVTRVRGDIQNAAEQIADAGSDSRRIGARYWEGKSFIELEFEDVVGLINQNDPKLAQRLGGDNKLDTAEILSLLEERGIITKWDKTDDHHISTFDAMQGKAGLGGIGSDFRSWNEQAVAKLDVNKDGQLGGQEVWDALRLADYIDQNKDVMAAISGGVPYQAKHDINGDKTLDQTEIARALMNAGVSDAKAVDSPSELNQLLNATQSAKELLNPSANR